MRKMMNLMALGAILALGASCVDGTGQPTTSTVTAALDGTGGADNCPATYNPPSMDLGASCLVHADCLGVAPVLASGETAPAFCVGEFEVEEFGWSAALIGTCVAQADLDGDGVGDECDADDDGDLIADDVDNCQAVKNTAQIDTDGDGTGDACDPDDDEDGILDADDNCPLVPNPGQEDADGDGVGDECVDDNDGDGVLDANDNCPNVANPGQEDDDDDDTGDACDPDDDNDGSLDVVDCEPFNPGIFPGNEEACNGMDDNCDGATDENFSDTDEDGVADCVDTDDDGDTVPDVVDNCPTVPNLTQHDIDGDSTGDACDADIDGDGIENINDNCPLIVNAGQEDIDMDEIGDVCDVDCDGDGIEGACTPDADGDGYAPPQDCLEGESSIHPGAEEVCNGVDDNCDGEIDEGATCGAEEICMGFDGCQPAPGCTVDAQCDDGNPCTDDLCVAGACAYESNPGCCVEDEDCTDGYECAEDMTCVETCVPKCGDAECGGDGCGGSCGECADGESCSDGTCLEQPDCVVTDDCDEGFVCIAEECIEIMDGQPFPFSIEFEANSAYLAWYNLVSPNETNHSGSQPSGKYMSEEGEASVIAVGYTPGTCYCHTYLGMSKCGPLPATPAFTGCWTNKPADPELVD